jgi:hypothetical protein
VLERLKGQSTALLQALGNGGGMAGAADENALAQVCLNFGLWQQQTHVQCWHLYALPIIHICVLARELALIMQSRRNGAAV